MLRSEIYTKLAFSQGDKYKHAYWEHRHLYLNVRFIVKPDSQFSYSGPVFFFSLRFLFHLYVFKH